MYLTKNYRLVKW